VLPANSTCLLLKTAREIGPGIGIVKKPSIAPVHMYQLCAWCSRRHTFLPASPRPIRDRPRSRLCKGVMDSPNSIPEEVLHWWRSVRIYSVQLNTWKWTHIITIQLVH